MIEQVLAGIVLAVCVALLLRMLLRERQRRRVDAAWQRAVQSGQHLARRLWFWRRHRRHATREAEDLIRRAHRGGDNVIRPESFKDRRKPH